MADGIKHHRHVKDWLLDGGRKTAYSRFCELITQDAQLAFAWLDAYAAQTPPIGPQQADSRVRMEQHDPVVYAVSQRAALQAAAEDYFNLLYARYVPELPLAKEEYELARRQLVTQLQQPPLAMLPEQTEPFLQKLAGHAFEAMDVRHDHRQDDPVQVKPGTRGRNGKFVGRVDLRRAKDVLRHGDVTTDALIEHTARWAEAVTNRPTANRLSMELQKRIENSGAFYELSTFMRRKDDGIDVDYSPVLLHVSRYWLMQQYPHWVHPSLNRADPAESDLDQFHGFSHSMRCAANASVLLHDGMQTFANMTADAYENILLDGRHPPSEAEFAERLESELAPVREKQMALLKSILEQKIQRYDFVSICQQGLREEHVKMQEMAKMCYHNWLEFERAPQR